MLFVRCFLLGLVIIIVQLEVHLLLTLQTFLTEHGSLLWVIVSIHDGDCFRSELRALVTVWCNTKFYYASQPFLNITPRALYVLAPTIPSTTSLFAAWNFRTTFCVSVKKFGFVGVKEPNPLAARAFFISMTSGPTQPYFNTLCAAHGRCAEEYTAYCIRRLASHGDGTNMVS